MNIIFGNTLPVAAEDPRCFEFINLSTYWRFSRVIIPSDNTSAQPIIFTVFGQISRQECFLTTAGRRLRDFETHAPNYSASFWLEPCYSHPLLHARWRNAISQLRRYLDIDRVETTDLLSDEHPNTMLKLNWFLITEEMVLIFFLSHNLLIDINKVDFSC